MNIQPEQLREKPFFNREHLIFLFFSRKGRVNRKRYLLSGLLLCPPYFLVEFLFNHYLVIPLILSVFVGYMGLMLSIKRAHDRNKSGHFCWLLFVPVLLLWPGIELMFFKGTSGDNRFGGDMLSSKNTPGHTTERTEQHTEKRIEENSFLRAQSGVKRAGYLGIYLGKDKATVVCLGPDKKVIDCFSVSAERKDDQPSTPLASLIAHGCAERGLEFSDVAIALDCRMFMQHNVHSQFTDPKQIAATIRFDAEEALSTDITDVALAFKIISTDENGSKLTVFTAQHKVLSQLLASLKTANIDPVSIEPDVSCLSRFISQNISAPADSHPLYAMLAGTNGYFIVFSKSGQSQVERTFLIGPAQHRGELLAREVVMTSALVPADEPVDCIKVFDFAESVNFQQLTERLGFDAETIDLAACVAAGAETLADCHDHVAFAIAYGAALAHLEKELTVNFRSDFMPYQGRKMRLQKALKFASISVCIFMLAVGMYFQMQLMQRNKYRGRLREKFQKQYSAVMLGQKLPAKTNPVNKLKSERRRIENAKSGQLSITGEETIAAKLTSILHAFNECAVKTNLNIESISITAKAVSITGDTSSRKNTLKLFKLLKGSENSQKRLQPKGRRDGFSITIVPPKR